MSLTFTYMRLVLSFGLTLLFCGGFKLPLCSKVDEVRDRKL